MKPILLSLCLLVCTAFGQQNVQTIYDSAITTLSGQPVNMSTYKGNVLLIVNTASKCVFSAQYKELQALYDTYKDQGFFVLGFPCDQFLNQEFKTHEEIKVFLEKRGITFPVFEKINVNGKRAHPLFTFLKEMARGSFRTKGIKWNFTKFLVDRNGNVVQRYSPRVNPLHIEDDIKALLSTS